MVVWFALDGFLVWFFFWLASSLRRNELIAILCLCGKKAKLNLKEIHTQKKTSRKLNKNLILFPFQFVQRCSYTL